MNHKIIDAGVASQIGAYSDAILVQPGLRWLYTSGTPGLTESGELPPDITGQAEIAWQHILRMLDKANMGVVDIVKATHSLIRAEDIPAYAKVRSRFLGDHRPASMLSVVPQLVRPEFLLEIEIVAAKA
ncbi:RidA family protein [Bradyrhizobium sp. SYSU BS000235]|uniref:RidA family protein n=1 Tax=Bradyrhizobium sp. SYSU BS000235 TaxID=3411332 RepID=UPI003C719634